MHRLHAVLGAAPVVKDLASCWHHAQVVDLPQGVALIPLTRALCEDVAELVGNDRRREFPLFESLSDAMAEVVRSASSLGSLAVIETVLSGTVSEQRAVVWEGGQLVLGPLDHSCSVNAALQRLGVRAPTWCDEFDALHLATSRSTEDATRLTG